MGDAKKALKKIKKKDKRLFATANLNLIEGKVDKAFNAYKGLKNKKAQINSLLAAMLIGNEKVIEKVVQGLDVAEIFKNLGIEDDSRRASGAGSINLNSLILKVRKIEKKSKKVKKKEKTQWHSLNSLGGRRGADPQQAKAVRILIQW